MKCKYLLLFGLLMLIGCSSEPAQSPGHYVPVVKKTDDGGAVLPGGVSLPPAAVKAGAAKGFETPK